MGCVCQECGRDYKLDLIISDNLWELIKPKQKSEGAGLLCGGYIISKIENVFGYSGFILNKI